MSELLWFVAHTKPRCEKKLVKFCEREGISATLPCYRTAHKYRGKTIVFQKPLFPGYVFLQIFTGQVGKIRQSDHVANLLSVSDQALLSKQLGEILLALDTDLEIRIAPAVQVGTRVKIKHGPLRGIEGLVEERNGISLVMLRLDFIGQAAAVKMDAEDIEIC